MKFYSFVLFIIVTHLIALPHFSFACDHFSSSFLFHFKLGDLLEWIEDILTEKKSVTESLKVSNEVEKKVEVESDSTEGQDNVTGELNGNTVKGINDTGEKNEHPYVPYTLSSAYVPDITGQPPQTLETIVTYEIPSTMYVQDCIFSHTLHGGCHRHSPFGLLHPLIINSQ